MNTQIIYSQSQIFHLPFMLLFFVVQVVLALTLQTATLTQVQLTKFRKLFFSRKSRSLKHPDLYFNRIVVEKVKTQKHLGLNLDERLNYRENLKNKCAINNKRIGMLKKLSNYLPRHSLTP